MAIKRTRTVVKVVQRLEKIYPEIKTSLNYDSPLQLLIATILSAQCTDERVNRVTRVLFKKYSTLEDFATADLRSLEEIIRSTGYYHSKARHILEASKMILGRFGSKVPETMDGLLQLPGVGRKTANIVLSVVYDKHEGIAVDTHVSRLSRRLRLTQSANQDRIERDLVAATPREIWSRITMLLILHGRNACYARNPNCSACILNDLCPSAFSFEGKDV